MKLNSIKTKIMAIVAVTLIGGGAYLLGNNHTFAPEVVSASPVLYSQDTVTTIYENASPAVVEIQVTEQGTGFYGQFYQEGQGSGFLVDEEGHILTNNHVVEGASSIEVVLDNGETIDATVVGTDATNDLAVISVDSSAVAGLVPLEFVDSSAVKPGEMAIALGSPYGLYDSVTVGVISGLDRTISSNLSGMLQTDAAINPGNSGGPLLNAEGKVIGINTAIESASGSRGIGFAVPSNVAVRALPDLLAGRRVERPWLGISGTALTQSKAEALGLSIDQGVYVISVITDSPADKAGLEGSGTNDSGGLTAGGDVITAADGKTVSSVEELSSYFNTKQVGDEVTLSVLRDGSDIEVRVTLEAWPADSSSPSQTIPDTPVNPWGWNFDELFPNFNN